MCRKADESIDHIVSGCSKLAQKEYKRRHDKFRRHFYLERLEYWERFLKSKATGCGSISTVFSSIVLLCVSSIIIMIKKQLFIYHEYFIVLYWCFVLISIYSIIWYIYSVSKVRCFCFIFSIFPRKKDFINKFDRMQF